MSSINIDELVERGGDSLNRIMELMDMLITLHDYEAYQAIIKKLDGIQP